MLRTLIGMEAAARQERALARRIREARLPPLKTLADYDFNFPKRVPKAAILRLFDCDFIDRHGCSVLWGRPAWENLNQHNAPLVTQECEGRVAVTDPTHPLFGQEFRLLGLARLPGHVRHCQVEILPGQYGFIPVASTSLRTEPRPAPTILTLISIADLVATFQALNKPRRVGHAAKHKSERLEPSLAKRPKSGRRGHHSHSHGGARK